MQRTIQDLFESHKETAALLANNSVMPDQVSERLVTKLVAVDKEIMNRHPAVVGDLAFMARVAKYWLDIEGENANSESFEAKLTRAVAALVPLEA